MTDWHLPLHTKKMTRSKSHNTWFKTTIINIGNVSLAEAKERARIAFWYNLWNETNLLWAIKIFNKLIVFSGSLLRMWTPLNYLQAACTPVPWPRRTREKAIMKSIGGYPSTGPVFVSANGYCFIIYTYWRTAVQQHSMFSDN